MTTRPRLRPVAKEAVPDGRREHRMPVLGSTLGPAFICLSNQDTSRDTSQTFATEATIRNLSINGISASVEAASALTGHRVWIDVPLVGRKEAEVNWHADGVVGCRFLIPLTESELLAGIASGPIIRDRFPGLAQEERPLPTAWETPGGGTG